METLSGLKRITSYLFAQLVCLVAVFTDSVSVRKSCLILSVKSRLTKHALIYLAQETQSRKIVGTCKLNRNLNLIFGGRKEAG